MDFQEKYKEILSLLQIWHFKAKASGERNPYFLITKADAGLSFFEITFWNTPKEEKSSFSIQVDNFKEEKVSAWLLVDKEVPKNKIFLRSVAEKYAYEKYGTENIETYKKSYTNIEEAIKGSSGK